MWKSPFTVRQIGAAKWVAFAASHGVGEVDNIYEDASGGEREANRKASTDGASLMSLGEHLAV
jgi:hypothetical protein